MCALSYKYYCELISLIINSLLYININLVNSARRGKYKSSFVGNVTKIIVQVQNELSIVLPTFIGIKFYSRNKITYIL